MKRHKLIGAVLVAAGLLVGGAGNEVAVRDRDTGQPSPKTAPSSGSSQAMRAPAVHSEDQETVLRMMPAGTWMLFCAEVRKMRGSDEGRRLCDVVVGAMLDPSVMAGSSDMALMIEAAMADPRGGPDRIFLVASGDAKDCEVHVAVIAMGDWELDKLQEFTPGDGWRGAPSGAVPTGARPPLEDAAQTWLQRQGSLGVVLVGKRMLMAGDLPLVNALLSGTSSRSPAVLDGRLKKAMSSIDPGAIFWGAAAVPQAWLAEFRQRLDLGACEAAEGSTLSCLVSSTSFTLQARDTPEGLVLSFCGDAATGVGPQTLADAMSASRKGAVAELGRMLEGVSELDAGVVRRAKYIAQVLANARVGVNAHGAEASCALYSDAVARSVPADTAGADRSSREACVGNMWQITEAKDRYALEYGGSEGMTFSWANIAIYIKDVDKLCCPDAQGPDRVPSRSYDLGGLQKNTTCRIKPDKHDLDGLGTGSDEIVPTSVWVAHMEFWKAFGVKSAVGMRIQCIGNLRRISEAKDRYAIESGGTSGMVCEWKDLAPYLKAGNLLHCPCAPAASRTPERSYDIGVLGKEPACRVDPRTHNFTYHEPPARLETTGPVPAGHPAAQKPGSCIENLRMISDAKDQYALEYGGTEGMAFQWKNLAIYIKTEDMARLYCPSGNAASRTPERSYDIGVLGKDPTCRIQPRDHKM